MNEDSVRELADGPREKEGDIVGAYQLVRLLGEGSMGRVFLAKHTRLGREVALKILRPEHVRNRSLVRRFFQEARAVNQINHEHIVEVFDFVEEKSEQGAGRVYCVMERLQGVSLSELLKRQPIPVARAARIMRQVCAALEAAHRVGVVHRDVKPDNIFIVERSNLVDYVKVLDFGVAKLTALVNEEKASATLEGTIIGTPSYMSPEQAAGLSTDPRTDIYGVGIVLYEMLAGKPPFDGTVFGQLMVQIITQPPPPLPSVNPAKERIAASLKALVTQCLDKDPLNRPQSMAELGEVLATLGAGQKLRWPMDRRWWHSALALAVTAMVVTAAIASWRSSSKDKRPLVEDSRPSSNQPASPRVHLTVSSLPPGARVTRLDTGATLGVTPLAQQVLRFGQPVLLRMELEGYQPADRQVTFNQDVSLEVMLTSQTKPGTDLPLPPRPAKKPKLPKRMSRDGTIDPFAK